MREQKEGWMDERLRDVVLGYRCVSVCEGAIGEKMKEERGEEKKDE